MSDKREGNLEAPTRHALDWKSEEFYNRESLDAEMERVFDETIPKDRELEAEVARLRELLD